MLAHPTDPERFAVYKYPLDFGLTVLELPLSADHLHVGIQDGLPVLWAMVDLGETETTTRFFAVVATGQPFEGGYYLNTLFVGPLVFHAFQVVRAKATHTGTP